MKDGLVNNSLYRKIRENTGKIAVHSGNLIVGDAVMLNPLVRSLRDSFPDASLDYIGYIQPFVRDFVKRVLPVDNFVELDLKKTPLSDFKNALTAISEIRHKHYDLVVDNQMVAANTVILKIAKKKWLLSQSMNGLLSDLPVPQKKNCPEHIIDRSVAPLELMGLPCIYDQPSIKTFEIERAGVNEILKRKNIDPDDTIIGLSPYSNHEMKNLPIEKYISLVEKLSYENVKMSVVFISSAQLDKAKSDFKSVIHLLNFSIELMPESLNINKAVPLLAGMTAFIGNDSGLAHISASLGIPTVVIFGPTSPRRFAPRGAKVRIIHDPPDCAPCNICKPCKNNKDCFSRINPDLILNEIHELTH